MHIGNNIVNRCVMEDRKLAENIIVSKVKKQSRDKIFSILCIEVIDLAYDPVCQEIEWIIFSLTDSFIFDDLK
jgi:hypothetical protein